MKNEELQFSNQYNIQWFPVTWPGPCGVMEQEIQHVDASLILLDARIPLSSLNPEIERITARKPRLYALNKADLATRPSPRSGSAISAPPTPDAWPSTPRARAGPRRSARPSKRELSGLLARRQAPRHGRRQDSDHAVRHPQRG